MRKFFVSLLHCCCSCCCCACCGPVPDDVSDTDEHDDARGRDFKEAGLEEQLAPAQSSQTTSGGGDGPVSAAKATSARRHSSRSCLQNPSVGMVAFLTDASNARIDSTSGKGPTGAGGNNRLATSSDEHSTVAEEFTAAVTTAIQNSPISACFRTKSARMPSLKRMLVVKRAQQAWRRAMRAGGPFAPGSLVGAVAADNHRRSYSHVSPLNAQNLYHHTTQASAPLATISEGFQSVRSGPAASHVSMYENMTPLPPSPEEDEQGPDLSRLSQVSNASSYYSVLSHDARHAFREAGVRPMGGAVNTHAGMHHGGHHHHAAAHISHVGHGGNSRSSSMRVRSSDHHAASSPHASTPLRQHPRPEPLQIPAVRSRMSNEHAGEAAATPESPPDSPGFLPRYFPEDAPSFGMHSPSPFQHSSHPAVEAFRAGSLGLGFSGGGFLFPWHLGVVTELKDMGIINDTTQLAGASCGAIIVACVNSGMDLHALVDKLLEFADDCRTRGTAGRLRYVIEHFMTKHLPPDAHLRCNGRTHLQLTRVFPYLKVMSISEFYSKEDLVSAIATSSHIPAYNDGSLVARFRGGLYIDGGVLRHLPAPPRVAFSAGVSCVPLKFLNKLPGANKLSILRHLAISPDLFQDFPYEWQQLAGLVLVPAPDPVLLSMIEHGKRDARTWAAATGLTAYLSGTMFVPKSPQPSAESMPGQQPRQPHSYKAGTSAQVRETDSAGPFGSNLESGGSGGETSGEATTASGSPDVHTQGEEEEEETAAAIGAAAAAAAAAARPSRAAAQAAPEVEVQGAVQQGPAAWNPAENVYSVRVKQAGPAGLVTIRVKGQGGAPDTLVTLELPPVS